MRIILLLLIVSCGQQKNNDCIHREEAILRCQADKVADYFPMKLPKYEVDFCNQKYFTEGCY